MDHTSLQAERQRALRNIRQTLAPHLWVSSYVDQAKRPVAVWVPRDRQGRLLSGRRFPLGGYCLDGFVGLTPHAAITSLSDGMALKLYNALPLEDLLALERWVTQRFTSPPTRASAPAPA